MEDGTKKGLSKSESVFGENEEDVMEILQLVGPVKHFRPKLDQNGKSKGYGFCEYKDIEIATSALRNLKDLEVGGKPLRVDNANNEPSQGKKQHEEETYQELLEMDESSVDISKMLKKMAISQKAMVLSQMKILINSNEKQFTQMMRNDNEMYSSIDGMLTDMLNSIKPKGK